VPIHAVLLFARASASQYGRHHLLDSVPTTRWPTPAWRTNTLRAAYRDRCCSCMPRRCHVRMLWHNTPRRHIR